jgi:hypothetical protein
MESEVAWQDDPVLAAHYVIFVAMGESTGAKQPGGFARLLVQAIFHADRENQARLRQAYPVFVDAVLKYKNQDGGYAELGALAGLDPNRL